MIHVQEIMNFCKHKGFHDGYNAALAQMKETVSRKSTATKKLKAEKDDPRTTKGKQKALNRSNVIAKLAVTNAKKELLKHGSKLFSLYETLLGENAQVKWSRIVETKIGAAPWTDLQGQGTSPCPFSWAYCDSL